MNHPRLDSIRVNRSTLIAMIALVVSAALAPRRSLAAAELDLAYKVDRKAESVKGSLPFQSSDYLRICLDPMRGRYFLGEPIVVPLRLVNHTQLTVTAVTNFNPRSSLEITIRKEGVGEKTRRTNGPYDSGNYPPEEIPLYPLDEVPISILLWGDKDTPNGLLFPEPGKYMLTLNLDVTAQGSQAHGKIPPVDSQTLRPIQQIPIEILPTPPEWSGLLEALTSAKSIPDLHVRVAPDSVRSKLADLIKQYPATPITPYITYALGLNYNIRAKNDPEDQESFRLATQYLQMTGLADSFYKAEAYENLMLIYDRMGMGDQAYQACLDTLKNLPPAIAARKGSHDTIRKYLKNSGQPNPVKYWDMLK